MSSEDHKLGDSDKVQGKLNPFTVRQKSKFQAMSNNNRVFPLDNNQIEEENSILEKDTPIINFNAQSSNQQDFLSPQNSCSKFIGSISHKDIYNRHYSIDASKFLSPPYQSESNQYKSGFNIEEIQEEQYTKRNNLNTNQNLQMTQGEFQLNGYEKESDKKTTEVTDLYNRKSVNKFALKYNKEEPKKRYSEFIPSSQKLGFSSSGRVLRRNGVAPNQNNKQLLGRITFLNVQSAQNQASSENESTNQENQQVQNISSFFLNKKLSLSWRFINILVLIQNLINKLKISSQTYRLSKLNSTHYLYINDITHIVTEKKNIYKNQLTNVKEFLQDLKLIKLIGKFSVLQPEYMVIVFWKTLMLIVILSQIVYLPIKIAFFDFHPELSQKYYILLNYLPLAICFFDILINFNLAFFSAEGVVIQDRIGIITNYLRFSFWLDLITTFSLLFYDVKYLDLCFLLRIFQFLEIVKYLDERFQFSQRFNTAYTLIKLIASIIILAHVFGCGFYYMSFYDSNYNWVVANKLTSKPWATLYLKSVYFIIITMITVGFGDITPQNNAETIYVLGIALLSCFQFGYTVNIIGSLFQEKAQKEAIIKQFYYIINYKIILKSLSKQGLKVLDIDLYEAKNDKYLQIQILNNQIELTNQNKDMSLQTLVLKNLDYIQTQQIDAPEQGLQILDQVSENLKNQVKFEFYWKILKNQPFLNHYFSQSFLKALTSVMTEKTYIPGEFVYQINEQSQANSIYILLKGQVDLTLHQLYQKNSKKKFIIQSKKAGEMFGHHSFFTSGLRETDCECHVTSHIVSCTQENFLVIAKEFPNDYEKFCFLKDQILLYQNDKNIKCVACLKFGHSIIDCPFIHNTNHKDLIIHKFNYSEDQKRNLDFVRKQKKNNTLISIQQTRKDLKKLRIKLVRSLEQQREKKQKKNYQANLGGVKEILSAKFLAQSSNLYESISENSSVDSSDISDFKYEIQLEEEKNFLKKQHPDFPYMSSYYDKQFYHRYSKISLNDKHRIISSSNSSEELSEESKSESEESEGTIFMNNINYNQTINEFDLGYSESKIDQLSEERYGSQKFLKKMKMTKGVSKLNQKIAQIIKYNQDHIQNSIDQKNLRQRTKRFRPDSAPQRKSIIENHEISNKLSQQIFNKKRPSSVRLKTQSSKINLIFSFLIIVQDLQQDQMQQETNNNLNNQFSIQNDQLIPQYEKRLIKSSKFLQKNNNQKQKQNQNQTVKSESDFKYHILEAQDDENITQEIDQQKKKRFSEDMKLSKSQIVSEESLNSSKSSKISTGKNKHMSNSFSSSSIIKEQDHKKGISKQEKSNKKINHKNYANKKSSLSNQNIVEQVDSVLPSMYEKTSNTSFDNQFECLNSQEGLATPKLLMCKNQQQKKAINSKFITSIKMNSPKQKIDSIKKHFLDDVNEDIPPKKDEKKQQLKQNQLKIDDQQQNNSSKVLEQTKLESNSILHHFEHDPKNTLTSQNLKQFNKLNLNIFKKEQSDTPEIQQIKSHKQQTNNNVSKKKPQTHSKRNINNGIILQNQQLPHKDQIKAPTLTAKPVNVNLSSSKQNIDENINLLPEQQNLNQKDKNIKANINHDMQHNNNHDDKNQLQDLFQTFEKMKIFKIYFPNNNINTVLESYTKYSVKKFLASRILTGKNQSSIVPVIGQQNSAASFVSILKKRLLNKQRHSIIPQKQS